MAAYTIYLAFGAGKGNFVEWRYPNTTTTGGTGHASSSPLDLDVGDTVTFNVPTGQFGGGTVSGLSIFTDNSNFGFTGTVAGDITTRTVATGSTLADTFIATNSQYNTDSFFVERQGITTYSVTSGAISMDGVRDFLTTASNSSISMSDFYRGGSLVQTSGNSGVPASGAIDLADLYGVAKAS